MAQVTVNLNNYNVTPVHVLFEAVRQEAAALNVGVAGSEIVGIVPLEAMLMAADYYIEKENLFILEEAQKIRLVVERLGLNSVSPFQPQERIIEYIVAIPAEEPLASMTLRRFIEAVAERSSAPGGGSVAAAVAALGIGLGAMTAKLTYGVRKFEAIDSQMRRIIPPLHRLTLEMIPMIDADTNAFSVYMDGLRMPKDTPEQRSARTKKMQAGLKTAIRVPLETMQLGDQAWQAMCDAARYGNIACRSDIQVGARALETGIWGAYQNVRINMAGIEDEAFKAEIREQAGALAERATAKCAEVMAVLDKR
jgi:glutamate formiminotransferase/formiminotetrahydrofolate cyclodeaminase